MVERRPQLSDELRYRLLRELQGNPELSQRDLAETLGISLGKVNYCLRALVQKGWVKARNFKNNERKIRYMYYLTRHGFEEKAKLAVEFLALKLREVESLRAEIAEVQRQGREERFKR